MPVDRAISRIVEPTPKLDHVSMTAIAGPTSTSGQERSQTGMGGEARTAVNAGSQSAIRLGPRAAQGAAALISVRMAAWALAFVQNVVVARTVVPRELGLYAMALAVGAIASRIKQLGSAEKLVRDPDEDVAESFAAAAAVEAISAGIGIVALALAVLIIPWPGGDGRTRLVILLIGVMLFQSLAELPGALLHRRSDFRALAVRRMACTSLSVIATIGAAVAGAQVWALVIGQASGVVVSAAIFWWPMRAVRLGARNAASVRAYLAFGVPLWGSGLLYALAERGSTLVVSSVLGLSTLGYVHLAQALTLRLGGANDAANAAIYPALRSLSATPGTLRRVLDRTNRAFALVGIPIGVALAAFAPDWVPIVFGRSWVPAVPFVSVYCLGWGFSTIGYPCYLAFQARGDTRTVSAFGSIAFLGRFLLIAVGVLCFGERGLLVAVALAPMIAIATRSAMIGRLFPDVSLLRLAARPVAIAAVAMAATVAVSELPSGETVVVRVIAFCAAVTVATVALDRSTVLDAARQIRGAFRVSW
jgi:O-antigen/teichoic acid export membrane protein